MPKLWPVHVAANPIPTNGRRQTSRFPGRGAPEKLCRKVSAPCCSSGWIAADFRTSFIINLQVVLPEGPINIKEVQL